MNEEIWSNNTFSKILHRLGRTLIGQELLFSHHKSFLYTEVICANFRIDGEVDKIIDLFT